MKKLILVFILFSAMHLAAQETVPPLENLAPPLPPTPPPVNVDHDTVKIKLGDRDILIIERDRKDKNNDVDEEDDMDETEVEKSNKENINPEKKKKRGAHVGFLDIDLGVNVLLHDKNQAKNLVDDLENKPFSSWSTTLNFLPTTIYLGTKHLMLLTSFGYHIEEMTFKNKISFTPNKILDYTKDDNIKRSSFSIQHLQVPLMLYTQSNRIKGLGKVGIGFGGYAGILVYQESNVKKSDINQKIETEEDFGFNKYRYGITGRIDIGAIKLFANYDLSDTWKDNQFQTLECGIWFDF
ncbi:MAG TPA: outer membrane beta-barrel protein [Saprospiraceae bacterium]|jgi:hypothetical protein|nr:outer membrane beta-barrel protein [Saprospiraceae bacterium]